jgi:hypothetical protein
MKTPVSRICLRLCQAPPQVYNLVTVDRPSSCVLLEEGTGGVLRVWKKFRLQTRRLRAVAGIGRSQPIQLFFPLLFRHLRYVRFNSVESHSC